MKENTIITEAYNKINEGTSKMSKKELKEAASRYDS